MDKQISDFFKILRRIFDDRTDIQPDETVDWISLSRIARKQNLLPIFFESAVRLEGYRKSDAFEKDQKDTFEMVAVQIQRTNAFAEIYKKITAQGIFPIVMKGIVCRQLYGELSEHRPSGDEDIVVEVKDFQKVREILEKEQYVCHAPDLTERQLNQILEVNFYNPDQMLYIEVHTNLIGKSNEQRSRMNDLFRKVHEHGQIKRIAGVEMKVMEPTESLLFLILHAYKHFQNRGVGIRQMIDTLLFYREFRDEISEEKLQKALQACNAEHFWMDILYIGNRYLGLYEKEIDGFCCPEELLQDMVQTGVFGGWEKTDYYAAFLNHFLEDDNRRLSKVYALLQGAFPARQVLVAWYPYLEEKPWLLPVAWCIRWVKFIKYAKKDIWKVLRESLQKSSVRMETIKKYKK